MVDNEEIEEEDYGCSCNASCNFLAGGIDREDYEERKLIKNSHFQDELLMRLAIFCLYLLSVFSDHSLSPAKSF